MCVSFCFRVVFGFVFQMQDMSGVRWTSKETWLAESMGLTSRRWLDVSDSNQEREDEVFQESGSESCFHASDSPGYEEPVIESDDEIFHSSPSPSGAQGEDVAPPIKVRARSTRKRDKYEFLGKEVCAAAFARLLGIGSSTLSKIRHGEVAMTNNQRPPLPKHPQFGFTLRGETGQLWEGIVMFLWCLYHSEAEVMPNKYAMPGKILETQFPEQSSEQDPDAVTRLVMGFNRSLHTKGTDTDMNMMGPGTFIGPVRSLPHSNRTDLHWEYVAFSEARGLPAASYNTFLRVANKILGPKIRDGHLRFRKVNEHGQCDQCYRLKEMIRTATSDAAPKEARMEHHRHVLSQWLDRQVYWSFRSLSQALFSTAMQQGAGLLGLFTWELVLVFEMPKFLFVLGPCLTQACLAFCEHRKFCNVLGH